MASAGEIAVAALGGAIVGSFLNVVIHRLPRGESLVTPGSRCRRCGARIPVRYPAIELLTAAAFAAVVAARGADADLLLELPFVAVLIAVAGIDLEHQIVPNRIVAPAAAWALIAALLVASSELPELLVAGAAAFLALLLMA